MKSLHHQKSKYKKPILLDKKSNRGGGKKLIGS